MEEAMRGSLRRRRVGALTGWTEREGTLRSAVSSLYRGGFGLTPVCRHTSFGPKYHSVVARVRRFWREMERFLAQAAPAVAKTLRPGASEKALDDVASIILFLIRGIRVEADI